MFTLDNPAGAPAPAGPYSQVASIPLGDRTLLVLSGQISIDDEGVVVGSDMTAQSERVFTIIRDLLAAHGAGLRDIVNIRSFLTDLGALPEYAAVRRRHLDGHSPTSTTVEVPRLFRSDALLEIELTAVVAAT